ncbi:MAG: FliH/SctL family protein [Erythrobacter sp.]|uniref:FliH/SctL family protein n=1 Tax=Erythrobacter sp. TaxID=1042 RepID=UPI0032637E97
MANSYNAPSSDWLGPLLERPKQEDGDDAGVQSSGWLSELIGPSDCGSTQGGQIRFVQGLPFGRPPRVPAPTFDPVCADRREPDLADAAHEMLGDDLVDILRDALGENGQAEVGASLSEHETQTHPEAEPQIGPVSDPIAEAFERGEAAGKMAAGKMAADAEHGRQAALKLNLRQAFRALDQAGMDALAGELGETVISLCAQTMAEFTPDPGALHARCLKAAERLGSGAGRATLYLHPDDLRLIDEGGLGHWTMVGDPTAERGGLKFEGEDGSVSDRPSDWRCAIAAAIRGRGEG